MADTPGERINVGVKVTLLPAWNPIAMGEADAPEDAEYTNEATPTISLGCKARARTIVSVLLYPPDFGVQARARQRMKIFA